MRIVEAYIGEYASGKSENAVNRSIQLAKAGHKVTIADLDLVEPVYTLRPLKQKLAVLGVEAIVWETSETIGLGEAGVILHPAMRWALKREGDVILDVGYGAKGSKVLQLLEGVDTTPELKILLVLNTFRPITSREDDIVAYINELGRVDGIIVNGNRGEWTTADDIYQSFALAEQVVARTNLPLVALSVDRRFEGIFTNGHYHGVEVRFIDRLMPEGFW